MRIFIACQTIISDRKLVFIRAFSITKPTILQSCAIEKMEWKTIRLTVGQTKDILNNKIIIIIYWIESRAESEWSKHENLICLSCSLHNRIQGASLVIGNILNKQTREKLEEFHESTCLMPNTNFSEVNSIWNQSFPVDQILATNQRAKHKSNRWVIVASANSGSYFIDKRSPGFGEWSVFQSNKTFVDKINKLWKNRHKAGQVFGSYRMVIAKQ